MSDDLRHVVLRRFPLGVYLRSRAHFDELVREFQLVEIGRAEGGTGERAVPQRLLELVGELVERFADRVGVVEAQRSAAIARGETVTDLEYDVPLAARDDLVQLSGLLDECDEFCRSDDYLLTLATPPDVVEFRRWNVGQVIAQLDGAEPMPWPGDAI